ncbi:hypothetical protein AB0M28_19880 [Streptomyces sp. NPDC051940]|uniref:hypothetical protein n=1 Tax=Streptomyces sp. NPDC051940 TaxID=3155675 RepID=UPI00343119DF
MTTDDRPDLALLTAALSRDTADLAVYGQVLAAALAEALPAGTVRVERSRGLPGRASRVTRLEIALDERRLVLAMPRRRDRPVGEVATVVRGVVLSSRPVPLAEWTAELAAALAARAASDARARAALARLLDVP